jgi:hypothetical protein
MKIIDKQRVFEKVGHTPHLGQVPYHESTARFRVASCGRRFGKSMMSARDMEPELFIPNKRFWIIGPTYDLGEKEFRVIWNDLMIGQGFGSNRKVKRGYTVNQGVMFIEFPWGTRVQVRSGDHAHTLVGERLDGVLLAEAAKLKPDVWNRYVRPALADTGGWATFTSTPEGMNWFYDMWSLGQDPKFPQYQSWRFPSWDNPFVFPGGREDPEIKLLEQTLSYEAFQQEIAADFTSFVGKIYGEFQEDVHVREVKYNPNLPSYMAIDWGFVNPLAAIEFQVSPFDDILVWREYYKSYTRLEDIINEWKTRDNPPGYRIDCCFGDAADMEAVATVNKLWRPCLADPAAKENWRQGIEVVKRFLKLYEYLPAEEGPPIWEPKFFIDHSCANLKKEFQNYKSAESTPLTARELPQRQNDHGLDGLRYGLMHLYELGATHHLRDVYPGSTSPFLEDKEESTTFFTSGMRF